MRRTHLLAFAIAVALFASKGAHAQSDTNPPPPNVLLLLDTSGSMEKMIDGTDPEAPANNPMTGLPYGAACTGSASAPNRWGVAVQALTGDFGAYACVAMARTPGSAFDNEYSLGAQKPGDLGYFLPYHRPAQPIDANHVCVIGHDQSASGWPGGASPNPPQAGSDFDAARIQGYSLDLSTLTYSTGAGGTCAFTQQPNGLLDSAGSLVRFGLMTLDNDPGEQTGIAVSAASPLTFTLGASPFVGGFSYFHGWDGSTASLATHGRPGGCVTDPFFELGARNPAAPPWEGRMIRFADPAVPGQQAVVNAQIQSTILAARPAGANPLAALLDDAKWYLWGDANGPKTDPLVSGGCRPQYVVILTHGQPNLDLQPYCQADGPPTGKCPYDDPANIAAGLAAGSYRRSAGLVPNVQSEELDGPGGTRVRTFVIGFAMSNVTRPDGSKGACNDVVNSDGSLNTAICSDPAMQSAYGGCCALEKIAIAGKTDRAYFADTRGDLDAALGAILGTIVSQVSTRTTPVLSPTVSGPNGATGGGSSAMFVSSFQSGGSGVPWSGNVQRERLECTYQTGSYAAQTQRVDPAKGDDFAKNVDQDHATARHVIAVQPTTGSGFAAPLASASIRPYLKGPGSPSPTGAGFDGLGMYDGTEYEYDVTVTGSGAVIPTSEITPAALGISGNCPIAIPGRTPTTPFGDASCATIAWNFALGVQGGPSDWPSAVTPFPARYYNASDRFPKSAFGDVLHSTPVVVGPPSALLRDDSYQAFASSYTTQYRSGSTKPRRTVLYVATNDGLLHAFGTDYTAGDDTTFNTLKNNELWAFVPPAVMPNLIRNYPSAHNPLLDGAPVVKDTVYQRTTASAAADWHTTLVAGFGAGGAGYYALDVTDPEVTTRVAHAAAPQHGTTNTGATAYAAKTGPHFLWQLTDASLFGEASATPAITTVYTDPGDGGGLREIGVAILPGGGGTSPQSGACARAPNTTLTGTTAKHSLATPLAAGFAPQTTVRRWASSCTGAVRGRSVSVVRLDTGEVIRTFMRADPSVEPNVEAPQALLDANGGASGTNAAGYRFIGRVVDTPLDSPMTGTPVVYPNDVGAIAQKVFVGDADGTLWRFDLSNADPSQWFGEVYLDAYAAAAQSAAGFGSDASFASAARQPIAVAPVVATGRDGNVVVEVATGDQSAIGAASTYPTFVYATEEAPQTDPDTGTTRLRAQVRWLTALPRGEMVTGPMAVFDGVFYFATYAPATGGASCQAGTARLWGMDFTTPADGSSPPASGGLARLTDPATPTAPPAQFADQGTAVIPGVTVSASLACATSDAAAADPYVPSALHAQTANVAPSTYSLMMQVGTRGTTGGTTVQTASRTIATPRAATVVDSWASIVE